MATSNSPLPTNSQQQQNLDAITDDDFEYVDEEFVSTNLSPQEQPAPQPGPMIPDLFKQPPLVKDDLITETSKLQDQTVEQCLPFLTGEDGPLELNAYGLPKLNREKHIKFLKQSLGPLPGRFVAVDASRPWYLYWCLSGLTMMGEDVSSYRESIIETARTMQNESGGFGGGHGQTPHLATSYAVILAIALVGGEEAYDVIDRKGMWKWLCSLKQPDGGFQVCVGGEEDIRCVGFRTQFLLNTLTDTTGVTEQGGIYRVCYHYFARFASGPNTRLSCIRRRSFKSVDWHSGIRA